MPRTLQLRRAALPSTAVTFPEYSSTSCGIGWGRAKSDCGDFVCGWSYIWCRDKEPPLRKGRHAEKKTNYHKIFEKQDFNKIVNREATLGTVAMKKLSVDIFS